MVMAKIGWFGFFDAKGQHVVLDPMTGLSVEQDGKNVVLSCGCRSWIIKDTKLEVIVDSIDLTILERQQPPLKDATDD